MQLGYFGINITSNLKREFLDLMQEAGFKYISLEELCIQLCALLISTERNALTDGPSNMEYLFWTKELQASLALIPVKARKDFVIAECLAYQQTRLSSGEHLV